MMELLPGEWGAAQRKDRGKADLCPAHLATGPHTSRKGRGRIERLVRPVRSKRGLDGGGAKVDQVVARRQGRAGRGRLGRDVDAAAEKRAVQGEAEFLQLVPVERLPEGLGLPFEGA